MGLWDLNMENGEKRNCLERQTIERESRVRVNNVDLEDSRVMRDT